MKFMTLWTDDFLAGTHSLTPEQRGVFITVICHYVNKDRVVPDNDRHLARLCNIGTRRYRTVKKVLLEGDFLTIRDGHIWVEKSSAQWNKDLSFSEKQRQNALKKHRVSRAKLLEQHNSDSAILSPSLKKEEEGADAPRRFAFEGRVIKLNSRDLERWRSTFKNIPNIEGELEGYDVYLSGESVEGQRRWFFRTASYLAGKDGKYAAEAKSGSGERVAAI